MSAVRTFTHIVLDHEVSLLRRLHGVLEHQTIRSREEFVDFMKAAFEHGKLEPRQLADDLGYSFSSVYRWIDGRNTPHPSLWPRIIQWAMEAIAARIQRYEEGGAK